MTTEKYEELQVELLRAADRLLDFLYPTGTVKLSDDARMAADELRAVVQTLRREEQEPDIDDSVKCCPDCERPNQFGDLCDSCRSERVDA